MSQDEFERIQPAAVDIGAPAARTEPASRDAAKLPGAALLLAALVALAAAVIFVLPDIVAGRSAQPVAATSPASPAAAGAATAGGASPAPSPALSPQGAPYAQAQAERERAAAKSALDALVATQYELQQRGVEKWAAAEFAAATALARTGDEAYRSGSFAAAETSYREGQQAMQALLDGVAARLQDRLSRGDAALAADDAATATALFTEALAIEAGNPRAQRGLARAEARPRVLAAMARASEAEATGGSDAAAAAYREALALDADYAPARDALAALQARVAAGNYRARLSAGYAALSAGRLAAARSEFQAALKMQPGGAEAREGLQQAEFQLAQQRIAELLGKAEQAVAAEQWASAAEHYAALLAIDATLSTARDGKQNAETRLALDRALEQIAGEPERLNEEKTRAVTGKLITGAQAIAQPGPRLQAQLATARRLLQQYSTPVAVMLRSDGKTEVTVFRVGAFGPLTEKSLQLLPGNYVAVGQRGGYRDVRVEFAVRAGQAAADVFVQCSQKI
jgi:hypothetical protein